jgi:hypothetical protein
MGAFMMMVLVGVVVMYFIADKFGNKDSTASDSNSVGESLDSNGSETAPSIVPLEEYTTGRITKKKNIVVMKISIWWGIIGFGICLMMAHYCIVKDLNYVIVVDAWVFAVASVILGVLILIALFTRRFILDDNGITVKDHISFCGFTILDKTTFRPWSAVSEVIYLWNLVHQRIATGFHFHYYEGGRTIISYTLDDYKEGLKYAVKKIPKSKFSEGAKNKLKEMGIWKGE